MATSSISDFLLVPMEVQAVIVNDPLLSRMRFVEGTFDYENVSQFLTPAPEPFDDLGTQPEKGVHLHWELPAAFRSGKKAGHTDPISFLLVPNRWLILRHWPGQGTSDRQMKAWVVQSDYLGTDGSNSFLDPTHSTLTGLGKSVSLDRFQELSNTLFLKGIAPGNVSFSAFRANAKDVFSFRDDLGDLLQQDPQKKIHLSYLVLGWYSDATEDPLHGATDAASWAARTSELQWLTNPAPYAIGGASPPQRSFGLKGYGDLSKQFPAGSPFTVTGSKSNDGAYKVAAAGPNWDATDGHLTIPVETAIPSSTADGYIVAAGAPSSWPTRTLPHGLLYNVFWQNSALPERLNGDPATISDNVKLAVGNSAIDALAAMIVAETNAPGEGGSDSETQADAAALEAFQTNMLAELDKAGGQAQLDKQLRGKWFGADDGGTLWSIIVNPAYTSGSGSIYQPNTEQEAWLAQMNFYQQGLDRETRVLESMRYDLYALWWLTQRINAGNYIPPSLDPNWDDVRGEITGQLPVEAAVVNAQIENVAAWQTKVSALKTAAPSYQSGQTTVSIQTTPAPPAPVPPLLLKAQKMPRFFEPADPVILISGLGASVNQTNRAKAGQDALPCRLGSQCISALKVDGATVEASSLASHVAIPNGQNGGQHLPLGVTDSGGKLALESVLLDPHNASLIATVSGKPEADLAAAIRAGEDYTGVAPDPISATQWQQAWIPLFLDWEVTWYPTVASPAILINQSLGNGPQWRFDRDGWAFDGLDYNWTGGDVSTPERGPGSQSYTIGSVDTASRSYTIARVGNLGWQFVDSSEFRISGSSDTYTVTSTTCDANGTFTIRAAGGAVALSQAGKTITPEVLAGGPITTRGRTFVTPQATFNFRARLEQYLNSHGGRYPIAAASREARSFSVRTEKDLSPFFVPGATFYVAQSTGNNGTYTVSSSQPPSYQPATKTFVIVASEDVPSETADGVLVSEPLADVAHLIDIIGGARYSVTAADSGSRSFTLDTEVDLNHLFKTGSTFSVGESRHNNGTYTVASTSYDEANNSFTVVANEAVPSSTPGGVAVPEPKQWDLLSQSLSGFNHQLLMRDIDPNQTANGTVDSGPAQGKKFSDLVGGRDHTVPLLSRCDGILPGSPDPPPYYFPVRAGFFALSRLAMVDRFGQNVDLLFANGNKADPGHPEDAWKTFGPIRSRWVTPEAQTNMLHSTRLIKLPPRSGLAGRLDFRFVSAPDGDGGPIPHDTDIDLVAGANPVAGWILPNHLDNGLQIYAADGSPLGELVLSQRGGTTSVEWFPTPMSTTPITDPADPSTGIPNRYLRAFVAGILGIEEEKRGNAFASFLQAIDETLWAVDPLGGRSDQNLSVLVGRPLALVRSRLKLVTCGIPTCDQSTLYAIPNPQTVTAVDTRAGTFTFAISDNFAQTGQFEPGATVTMTGSAHNNGVYHIVSTSFDGSTFTVHVAEAIPSSTVDGSLAFRPPEGGLTNTAFALRLGRADLYDDGLIGYYVGDDYSRCYNVHAPEDITPAGYLYPIGQNGGNYLSICYRGESTQGGPPRAPAPVADSSSIFVTLLVDPRGTINATTGILPTQELTLPARFYEGPLSRLELYFRTGPLLVDGEAIRLPRPSEQHGTWSWIQKNDPAGIPAAWEADPIAKSNGTARFPVEPLQLRDGWLKLIGTDLED